MPEAWEVQVWPRRCHEDAEHPSAAKEDGESKEQDVAHFTRVIILAEKPLPFNDKDGATQQKEENVGEGP